MRFARGCRRCRAAMLLASYAMLPREARSGMSCQYAALRRADALE